MKYVPILFIFLFIVSAGCKIKKTAAHNQPSVRQTEANTPVVNFSDQSTWLLGYVNPALMRNPPHSEWFIRGYDDYQFNQDIVNTLTELNKDELSIKVVFGTWCPDSRREVPRFMRILDSWRFPVDKVTFIGVDNAKHSPVRGYDSLNIERVPTFIIYKNNNEAGRIIENPVTSLEQDILNILDRNEK
jgi:thiol-disulfide isomerase/thioredoxin